MESEFQIDADLTAAGIDMTDANSRLHAMVDSAKKETAMTPTELLVELVKHGGAIVSSNDCTEMEIVDARVHGRFAVDDEGMGYVRRMKEWLDRIHKADDYNQDSGNFSVGGMASDMGILE